MHNSSLVALAFIFGERGLWEATDSQETQQSRKPYCRQQQHSSHVRLVRAEAEADESFQAEKQEKHHFRICECPLWMALQGGHHGVQDVCCSCHLQKSILCLTVCLCDDYWLVTRNWLIRDAKTFSTDFQKCLCLVYFSFLFLFIFIFMPYLI